MKFISDILFWISSGLLVPVVVLLIYFFGRSLLLLGSFFGQYLSMRKESAIEAEQLAEGKSVAAAYARLVIENRQSQARMEHLLAEYETYCEKELSLPNTLIKMGPMLGLMGTLIPMGPALVGLSTGDIATMAYNMQVAFATTVIGLFAAGIGFVTKQARQRWYKKSLNDLTYLVDLQQEGGEEA